MNNSKSKYNPSIGKQVITTGSNLEGIAYRNSTFIQGQVRQKYNPQNGRFELVDGSGRAVGYIPKAWKSLRLR